MRFNVLVALVVATFVASCSSFVSAGTTALDDYAFYSTKVVRRLGEDRKVQEERGMDFNMKSVTNLFKGKTSIPGKLENVGDMYQHFGDDAVKKLGKAGLNIRLLHKGDPKQVEKLVELFVKGAKKERSFWVKVLGWVAASIGVVSFVTLMYLLITGGPKGFPPTRVIGTTTPGVA
ncbi:unnamed protein product [Peronospora destructor]|uniref:RxLR effector protein n=1 Tax=Peronospora destructor TaxID=86335 RepID=A0AAV0UMW9_9STRA|nr:unnamed protein product [Peronospora destructor]